MRFAVTAVLMITLAAAVCAHSSQGPPAPPRAAPPRPAPPPSSPPVLGCLTAAANATECGSPIDATCACTNADFHFKSTLCLQAECKAEELAAAVGLLAASAVCASLSLRDRSPNRHRSFAPTNPAADISGAPSSADSSGSGYKSSSATPARCRSLRPTLERDSRSRWGLRCWVGWLTPW
ncbi:hypothetical protein DFH08DRAFT_1002386 [Mycena albidolilacea]|uniref:CFEM domain-containing protein n=1 Tax=Mycena albidolilacea TaxID=1033008 RepID=A0AAD7ESV1_9AGAR|nr:hypothetical protein DFH08DRAFT_1002386 [Mycena albidolilacea]